MRARIVVALPNTYSSSNGFFLFWVANTGLKTTGLNNLAGLRLGKVTGGGKKGEYYLRSF